MKVHKSLVWFIISALMCITLLGGCNLSFDTMLDSYNEQFLAVEEEKRIPIPGDTDFVPEQMLKEKYIVADNATLNLAGPKGATSYLWQIYSLEDNSEISYFKAKGTTTSINFVIYIANSPLKAGKAYKLTLTVGDGFGRKYSDTTKLIIYSD